MSAIPFCSTCTSYPREHNTGYSTGKRETKLSLLIDDRIVYEENKKKLGDRYV